MRMRMRECGLSRAERCRGCCCACAHVLLQASDIFSAGLVLYHLLSGGVHPFDPRLRPAAASLAAAPAGRAQAHDAGSAAGHGLLQPECTLEPEAELRPVQWPRHVKKQGEARASHAANMRSLQQCIVDEARAWKGEACAAAAKQADRAQRRAALDSRMQGALLQPTQWHVLVPCPLALVPCPWHVLARCYHYA